MKQTEKKCIFIIYTLPGGRVSLKEKREEKYTNWHIHKATRDA